MIVPASLILLLAATSAYLAARTVYRIWFHPLSKIPGSKLAAATHLVEFFYDVVCKGQFLFEIERMHQEYGPIVRINPREVHIIDPRFYDEIYASSARRRNKDPAFVPIFGLPRCIAATVDHDHHRFRRNILSDFFSKKNVTGLTGVVDDRVYALVRRLEEFCRSGEVLQLDDAMVALTSDVITHYCYGQSWDFLQSKAFRGEIRNATQDLNAVVHLSRFFPWLGDALPLIPEYIWRRLQPGISVLFAYQQAVLDQASEGMGRKKVLTSSRGTMFERMTDPSLPADERALRRIQDEALEVLTAGTETTADVLTKAIYYLLHNDGMWQRLRAELKQVLPSPSSTATWSSLEQLPFLSGVVNEALRLSYGLLIRLPRVAPCETLRYREYVIPPGVSSAQLRVDTYTPAWAINANVQTPVSSTSYFIHRDPTIFPNPDTFDPERWIGDGAMALKRFLVPFTKGSRICLGMK
ncbi:hypothetical protein AbraIFM66951_005949 [Aspergillus brasiliensis]|uniref:Cytochrome P450 n=1 Tax=Aspergillus brasiliensis TaxID=319629 RepID=A0A9W5YFP2_9EURO|nr:hypothetical protein AbraCBS73388_008230 [Aspergillus brasiliensis]GKZ51494.1 hypothetical protein AbraIFM66951_005949 [Aspergillus brasiliensis]